MSWARKGREGSFNDRHASAKSKSEYRRRRHLAWAKIRAQGLPDLERAWGLAVAP